MLLGKHRPGVVAAQLGIKAGKLLPGAFVGKKATVTFVTPYSTAEYAVTFDVVTLGNNYSPVAESKTVNGFVVNIGSANVGGVVEVLWQAMLIAE
jgi:hypothetical protein